MHDSTTTTVCPKCAGLGRVTYTRPGGWLREKCTPCGGRGTVDAGTADTLVALMGYGEAARAEAREAALGPVDGPCCSPAEADPCAGCVPPDGVPAVDAERSDWWPNWVTYRAGLPATPRQAREEEEAAWRAMCREESDARLAAAVFAAVKAAGSGAPGAFRAMLADIANAFSDHDAADVRFVGGLVGSAYDLACHLDAASGEQYADRRQAMLDAIEWGRS